MDERKVCNYADFLCRLIKRYFFWMLKFPCHTPNSLIKDFSSINQEALAKDNEEYESNSSEHRSARRQIVIVLTCLIYSIKNFAIPFILLKSIDFKNTGFNTSNQWVIDRNTIQVFCVRTNCTQFFQPNSRLGLDMRYFPIIPICYPTLSWTFYPTIYLNTFAILVHAMVGSIVMVWGVIMPINQFCSDESRCDTLMFLVAPGQTRNLMFLEAHKLYQDYLASFANYIKKYRKRALVCGDTNMHLFSVINPKIFTERRIKDTVYEIKAKQYTEDTYVVNISRSYEFQNQFVRACLPSIRTIKWQSAAQSIFIRGVVLSFLGFSMDAWFKTNDLLKRLSIASKELELVREEMFRSGCRAWYADDDINVLPPDPTFTMKWNLHTLVEISILLFVTILACCLVGLYVLVNHELNCWLRELQVEVKILIEITRLQSIENTKAYGNLNSSRERAGMIRYPLDECSNCLNSDRLTNKVFIQQLAVRMMSKSDIDAHRYANMLTQLHVSFRLFTRYVQHCSQTIPLLSLGSYLVTLGIISTVVWHSRLIGQFTLDHTLTALVCSIWSVSILYLMSNFHAKVSSLKHTFIWTIASIRTDSNQSQSRGNEKTFWSLMAALSERNPEDKRTLHLRLLWLKQLIVVTNEEGVALEMYGMRATHVNVLQVSQSQVNHQIRLGCIDL